MKNFLKIFCTVILSVIIFSLGKAQTTITVSLAGSTFTPNNFTINSNDTILFTNGAGHTVKRVSGPTSWTEITSFPTKLHSLSPGNYSIVCGFHSFMTATLTVNAVSGTSSGISQKYELVAAPNPFSDEVTLTVNEGNKNLTFIKVFDLIGTEVAKIDLTNKSSVSSYTLDFSQLKAGVYFCNVYSADGIVETKKLFRVR